MVLSLAPPWGGGAQVDLERKLGELAAAAAADGEALKGQLSATRGALEAAQSSKDKAEQALSNTSRELATSQVRPTTQREERMASGGV